MEQGVVLTGGGSLLHGLDARLQHETGMPITVARDPLNLRGIGSGQWPRGVRGLEAGLDHLVFSLIGRLSRTRGPATLSRRTLVTIAVLVLVSVTPHHSSTNVAGTHHITSGLKSVAHDVFLSADDRGDDILRPIGDFFAGSSTTAPLQSENQQLQATIGRLRLQANQTAALRLAGARARLTRASPYRRFHCRRSPAQMTQFDLSNFDADITSTRVGARGCSWACPWSGAGGLVGQVVQASHGTAIVQPDHRTAAPRSG